MNTMPVHYWNVYNMTKYLNVSYMTIFVMLMGNNWHCPTNIYTTLRVNTSGEGTVNPSGTPEFILGF